MDDKKVNCSHWKIMEERGMYVRIGGSCVTVIFQGSEGFSKVGTACRQRGWCDLKPGTVGM